MRTTFLFFFLIALSAAVRTHIQSEAGVVALASTAAATGVVFENMSNFSMNSSVSVKRFGCRADPSAVLGANNADQVKTAVWRDAGSPESRPRQKTQTYECPNSSNTQVHTCRSFFSPSPSFIAPFMLPALCFFLIWLSCLRLAWTAISLSLLRPPLSLCLKDR